MAEAAYGRPRASGSLGYTSSPRMNRRKDDERNAAHTVAPNSSRFPSVTTRGPGARSAWRLARPSTRAGSSSSTASRSEEHTSELQSPCNLVCRLLLEKKKNNKQVHTSSNLVSYHLIERTQLCNRVP